MSSRRSHYLEAEKLLAEGVEVVNRIANVGHEYHPYRNNGGLTQSQWETKRRDELGKKAMGIWAQAQVHATLANAVGADDVRSPI